MNKNQQQRSVTINGQLIPIYGVGPEAFVAIKPICVAIGVSIQTQLEKIKSDEILSKHLGFAKLTGPDGKNYEYRTIPLKFLAGWIISIEAKNVLDSAKEPLLDFKRRCYALISDNFKILN